MTIETGHPDLTPATVPLGSGPPTREELLVHYPAKFTWHQLKVFVNSGYVLDMARSYRNCSLNGAFFQ